MDTTGGHYRAIVQGPAAVGYNACMQPNERATERATDAPAEESRAGSDDPKAQAEAILSDSDEREARREESEGTVEHRTPTEDR